MKAKAFTIQFGGRFERLMSWIIIIKSIIIIGTRDCAAHHCGSFQQSPRDWQTGKQYKKNVGNNIIKVTGKKEP